MSIRRRLMMMKGESFDPSLYAVTKKTNPSVMAICYAQGWAANENYMTFEEAAAVTNVSNYFDLKYLSFNEFQYFTGVTSIAINSLRGLSNVILPTSLQSLGNNCLAYSTFTEILFHENIKISSGTACVLNNNNNLLKITWNSNTYPSSGFLLRGNPLPPIYSDNPVYYCENGNIWSSDKTKLYIASFKYNTSFSFLGTETKIGDAFYKFNNSNFVLTVPATVNDFSIKRDCTFEECVLKEVDMSNCSVGNKVPRFVGGTYTTIKFPKCTTVGPYGNLFNVTVTNLIINQVSVPTMVHSNTFTKAPLNIYVPDSAVNDYKAAKNWTKYASIIKPLSEFME